MRLKALLLTITSMLPLYAQRPSGIETPGAHVGVTLHDAEILGSSPLQAPALSNFISIIGNIRNANANSPQAKATALICFREIYLAADSNARELMYAFTVSLSDLLSDHTVLPRKKDRNMIMLLEEYQHLLKQLLTGSGRADKTKQVDQLINAIYTAASPTLADGLSRAARVVGFCLLGTILLAGAAAFAAWIHRITQVHGAMPALAKKQKQDELQFEAHYRYELCQNLAKQMLTPPDPRKVNIESFMRLAQLNQSAGTYTGKLKYDDKEYTLTVNAHAPGFSAFSGVMSDDKSQQMQLFNAFKEALIDRPYKDKCAHLRGQGIHDPKYFMDCDSLSITDTEWTSNDRLPDGTLQRITVKRPARGMTDFFGAMSDPNSHLSQFFKSIQYQFENSRIQHHNELQYHGFASVTEVGPTDVIRLEKHPITGVPDMVILSRKYAPDGSCLTKPLDQLKPEERMQVIKGPNLATGIAMLAAAPEQAPVVQFLKALTPLFNDSQTKAAAECQRYGIDPKQPETWEWVLVDGQNGMPRHHMIGFMPEEIANDPDSAEYKALTTKLPGYLKDTTTTPMGRTCKGKDGTLRRVILFPHSPGLGDALTHAMICRNSPAGKLFTGLGKTMSTGDDFSQWLKGWKHYLFGNTQKQDTAPQDT